MIQKMQPGIKNGIPLFSRCSGIFLLFFVLSLVCNKVIAQAPPLAAIGNGVGTPAQLNFKELKSVLKGEKQRWINGTKVVIALMKTSTLAGITTSKKIYGLSGDDLDKFWLSLVFQGKAKAPVFFNSVSDLQSFVAQTPGAIGIIDGSALASASNILVDGKPTF